MTIDPSASKTPFASITDDSYFKNQEEEILFSMHTVFRTHDIQLIDQDKQLFQVELTLTSDDDKDLRLLTECIIEETKGSNGWHRMTLLLIKLGQTNKAQEICESMLTQTTDEAEQAHLCYAISMLAKKA
ncbi:hypothetical protein I4U23_015554 [Adineta vaga]|nr:hypothetical protein I4U23_015554 [Adineta vaga]